MTTDEIEKHFGSTEKVAEFFGITSEAVYQWRNRPGRLIPKGELQKPHTELLVNLSSTQSGMASIHLLMIRNNHRKEDMAVGTEPKWKAEKQPAWLVAAIRKTIAALLVATPKLLTFCARHKIRYTIVFVMEEIKYFLSGGQWCFRALPV